MKKKLLMLVCVLCALILPMLDWAGSTAQAAVAASQVRLSRTSVVIDLAEGTKHTLSASVLPAGASQRITWSTSNSSVAKVSSSGVITARKRGTAVITATAYKTKIKTECIVTVVDSDVPNSVDIGTSTLSMFKGETHQLTPVVSPSYANQRVKWKTSSSSVVYVSSSGKLTAKKQGTATITCYSAEDSSVLDTVRVTVIDRDIPTDVEIGASSLSLLKYQTHQLTPVVSPSYANQRVKWKTSRSSVVSVSSSGLLTAKKAGTATITCYSAEDSSVLDTVVVTVTEQPRPKSISLTPATDVLLVGETLQLIPQQYPADSCSFFKWETSSSSRASVTQSGLVTAKRTGKVTITCRSAATSSVRVKREILIVSATSPHYVKLDAAELTMHPGMAYQLEPEVLPAGKDSSVKYSTSRSSVVSVSATGVLTAKKTGTATITVTSKVNSYVKTTLKVTVEHLPAPTSLTIHSPASVVAKGSEVQLSVTPYPGNHSAEVTWKSSNTSVAKVSSGGVVTGRKGGVVTITATSSRNSKIKATYNLTVSDPKSPTAITLNAALITMEIGEKRQMTATVYPTSGVDDDINWRTSSSSIARVSSSGVITARKAGTAIISAISDYNSSIGSTVMVTVVNRAAPTSISAIVPKTEMAIGETMQITMSTVPSGASKLFDYSTSSSSIVSVSDSGKLTAKKAGTATITIKSDKKSSVRTTLQITVYDATSPRSLSLNSSVLYLGQDDVATLIPTVLPENAVQTVTWKSSNTSVAKVSSDGRVTAIKDGTAVITCTTTKGGLSASCSVNVLDTTLAVTIPERTTKTGGIAGNLAKIEAIRKSAVNQVLSLAMRGQITGTESAARQNVINRAFEMQAFPWMTKKVQEYWSKAYAYKRYLPDTVYYGMPYIQTGPSAGYLNRRYNVEKALDEGRYTATGKGYYLLNQDKLLDKMYVGNDCSSFVSMSQFGLNHAASFLNTTAIAKSTYYRTLSSYSDLRPGDILVKSGDHTVLFLYYVDAFKTKMMIIEQGGNGSTVICSVFDTSWFESRGYVPRRQTSFRMN